MWGIDIIVINVAYISPANTYQTHVLEVLPPAEIPNEVHLKRYEIANGIAAKRRYGRCLPIFERVLSVIKPIIGSLIASQRPLISEILPDCLVERPSTYDKNC